MSTQSEAERLVLEKYPDDLIGRDGFHTMPSAEVSRHRLDFFRGFHAGEKSEKVMRLLAAAKSLKNEALGIVSAHELAIRQDSGNTNFECLINRLKQLEVELAAFNVSPEGECK